MAETARPSAGAGSALGRGGSAADAARSGSDGARSGSGGGGSGSGAAGPASGGARSGSGAAGSALGRAGAAADAVESGLAGVSDGYDRLWTPHRMVYVGGRARPAGEGPEDCPFCAAPAGADADGLIVARGKTVYALLNLFPYNPGHLLICPYRHVPGLTDLTDPEAVELIEFTRRAVAAIGLAKGPQGFNLGMNLGAVAGAGISAHLHQHVVPRWTGDSNFFPIVAHSRALPELLGATRAEIAAAWDQT